MDIAGVVHLSGTVIGIVGGTAGIFAYLESRTDRKATKVIQHIPGEVRPLLLEICGIAGDIEHRARSESWIETHLAPLERRWRPLAHVSISAMKGDQLEFAEVSVQLGELVLMLIPERSDDPSAYQSAMARQGRAAHLLLDAATNLHMRLLGQANPFPKNGDDRDVVPRTSRASLRRWARRA